MGSTEGPALKGNVTLRDIARELDISHVTVSLALRSNPRISEATQVIVKQKAAEMGYRQDPILSALSHYRSRHSEKPRQATLAWINTMRDPESFYKQEEYALYWNGAKEAAAGLGFCLEEFTAEELSLNELDQLFKSRNIHGVVVAPVTDRSVSLKWSDFPWQDYSTIRFGRSFETPSIHFVTSAQVSNTVLAFNKALEKGYQRIGFVGAGGERRLFLSGYLGCQFELQEDQRIAPLVMTDATEGLQTEELEGWMEAHQPDAVLTDVGELPDMLNALGYSIPGDVGLATLSIHDTPINTGIDQNPREIGATVIRTLVSLLNEHHFGIPAVRNSILVDGQWVEGSMLPKRES